MENAIHWLAPVASAASPKQNPIVAAAQQPEPALQTPLHAALLAAKNEIDRISPVSYWDDAKKITNPYEYIFLSLQRRMTRSISAIHPLSRSYFKMIELWDLLGLTPDTITATAHTAEGPGGFLEAIQDRAGHRVPMVAMTLKSTGRTVPGWRKSQAFLARHPMITITYGWDGTGNLYSLLNQQSFENAARVIGFADLYTADGGFDFSADFNGQENTVQRLLIAEALAALRSLKLGGTAIIKIFDTKSAATLDLLWILSVCFAQTGIVKPHTSRPANSERYWVGREFRGAPDWVLDFLGTLTRTDAPNGWLHLFDPADNNRPTDWLTDIRMFQEELERHQLNKIQMTLNFIRAPTKQRVHDLLLENVRSSRRWCQEHHIPVTTAYVPITDEAITSLNLEEAQEPFPAGGARMSSPASSQLPPMHRESTAVHVPRPPAVPAWRTALPASVLGRAPSQTDGGSRPSTASSQAEPRSRRASDPEPAPRGPHLPCDVRLQSGGSHE
jgi:hypothetical protein